MKMKQVIRGIITAGYVTISGLVSLSDQFYEKPFVLCLELILFLDFADLCTNTGDTADAAR